MRTEYIIRLDDACPTMDRNRWRRVEALLMEHEVKPIVAVVPENSDPDLIRGPRIERFWQQAQAWVAAGWMIALHGYSHTLRPSAPGIVPGSGKSEFVGLSLEEQRRRIRDGLRTLQEQNIAPEAWVAPAHGMDMKTLEALRAESKIRLISDSYARRPLLRWGFTWLPQQLWRPRRMPAGLWTICLHPNDMTDTDINLLSSFIAGRRNEIVDPREAASRAVSRGFSDFVFELAFRSAVRIRRRGEKKNG